MGEPLVAAFSASWLSFLAAPTPAEGHKHLQLKKTGWAELMVQATKANSMEEKQAGELAYGSLAQSTLKHDHQNENHAQPRTSVSRNLWQHLICGSSC